MFNCIIMLAAPEMRWSARVFGTKEEGILGKKKEGMDCKRTRGLIGKSKIPKFVVKPS